MTRKELILLVVERVRYLYCIDGETFVMLGKWFGHSRGKLIALLRYGSCEVRKERLDAPRQVQVPTSGTLRIRALVFHGNKSLPFNFEPYCLKTILVRVLGSILLKI